MLNPKLSNLAVNAEIDALTALLDGGGTLEIRSGTQPATADTAPPDGQLLATLTFGTPAFGAGVNGVATANAIGSALGVATGTATWYRAKTAGSATVTDGSIATSNANLIFNAVSVVVGVNVSVDSMVLTASKG